MQLLPMNITALVNTIIIFARYLSHRYVTNMISWNVKVADLLIFNHPQFPNPPSLKEIQDKTDRTARFTEQKFTHKILVEKIESKSPEHVFWFRYTFFFVIACALRLDLNGYVCSKNTLLQWCITVLLLIIAVVADMSDADFEMPAGAMNMSPFLIKSSVFAVFFLPTVVYHLISRLCV